MWGQHLDSTSLQHPDENELGFSGVGLGMHPKSSGIGSCYKMLLCPHLPQKLQSVDGPQGRYRHGSKSVRID